MKPRLSLLVAAMSLLMPAAAYAADDAYVVALRANHINGHGAGFVALKQLSPDWFAGFQADYVRSTDRAELLTASEQISTSQRNEIDDVLLVAHRTLCGSCSLLSPYIRAGAGAGYATSSAFSAINRTNDIIYNSARAESSGWFPVATAGLGFLAPLDSRSRWSLDFGGGYTWGRLNKRVIRQGTQAFPGETGGRVSIESSLTGPAFWLGVAQRF